MPRPILDAPRIHPAIQSKVSGLHRDLIDEVTAAIAAEPIVIIGMAVNPYPRRARRALDAAGLKYRYLSYGSYLSGWRRRTVLKMWTGWPTLPMIFVNGMLIGGATDLERLIADGSLKRMLEMPG